ncbi:MAG: hypothetical protein ABSA17_07705 [Rhabdochlamydiaceae bacterium]
MQKGFIRPLIPSIPERSIPISENCFSQKWNSFASFDLFGDGSLHLVDLPGHAIGQMGVAIQDAFFVADAKWGAAALPHKLGFLIQEDPKLYRTTFASLQNPIPRIKVIPTHTIEAHV